MRSPSEPEQAIDATPSPSPAEPPREQYTAQGTIPPPQPFPATGAPAPSASDRAFGNELGSRAIDTEGGGIDVAAAEAYNRSHIVDVVRFDRATHGQFARGDGQLDAVRIAKWQKQHHLEQTGCVDENTCLVAEGKPPLPPSRAPYVGPAQLLATGPDALAYSRGYRVPLTVSMLGKEGPAHVTVVLNGSMPIHDVEVQIGSDGRALLDLPIDTDMLMPGIQEVSVSATIGGETRQDRSSFVIEQSHLNLGMTPQQWKTQPPLPDPHKAREPIDQADAERFNRENVRNVVRFDRATKGYFAKTNGELDALAVAEWQTQHNVARSGKVDDDTVKKAEEEHGGLEPQVDPDGPELAHGAPFYELHTSSPLDKLGPNTIMSVDVHTRARTEVRVDWALTYDYGIGSPITRTGSQGGMTDEDGHTTVMDELTKAGASGAQFGELELEVSTPLGSAPLHKEQVTFQKS